ncbi:MAG: hypothetical protein KUG57_11900 [Ilumatobacteraceae bacterium]|nr:hypothetical protein [Ilumatobacteraceae bacterium]
MGDIDIDWLLDTRVAIVAGKGGVGSSTVAAAYALAAAREGANVLFIAVDARPGMGPLLGGRELDHNDRVLRKIKGAGQVRGRTIPADQAFGDYLEMKGVSGLLRRASSSASLPMIAAATPGLEHLLVLGKIKELEKDRSADLIIVDAPPAGHAAPFLRSATSISDVVNSGPIREQAVEVDSMLRDAERCMAMIVTLAEETPVTEAIELAGELTIEVGLALLPVVVNACWPDRPGLAKTPAMAARSHKIKLSADAKRALASSATFGRARLERQHLQIERLAAELELPMLMLPRLVTPRLTPHHLGELADAILAPLTDPSEVS